METKEINKKIAEFKEVIVDLCEGNPGALNVLMGMMREAAFAEIMWLKENGYKGSKIWVLFKDEHNCETEPFLASIRSKIQAEKVSA